MKLFYASASPFVRKVLVVAIEKGLEGTIEKVPVTVTPVSRDNPVVVQAPLGKIPSAVLPDGRALFDSRVIAAYVDSLKQPRLNPESGPAHFDALTLEALADGILDAGLLFRYETFLRPEALRWEAWHQGQIAKIASGLETLEKQWLSALNGPMTIGVIAAACALGWLSFRNVYAWPEKHPGLNAWFTEFSKRPSMLATIPHA